MLDRFYPVVPDVRWVKRLVPLGTRLIQLRIKDQQLIHARFVEEASLADIAQQFGLPSTAAAGMAITRAERRLKRQLAA